MYDYHIHTDHSGDGKTPLVKQVESAVAKGLREICITSHYDADTPSKSGYNFDLDFAAYYADVERCQKAYSDRIAIKIGVEIGLQAHKPHVQAMSSERIRSFPFDFVIASCHYMSGPDYHKAETWTATGMDKVTLQDRYLRHALDYMEQFDDFCVMGHLTYFSRFSPPNTGIPREMTYSDNAAMYDELLTELIRRGKGIEINTSTKDVVGYFMPDFTIAKRFCELGGEIITIGSDAHYPDHIGRHYDAAVRLLREAGFKAFCTFDRFKPNFIGI